MSCFDWIAIACASSSSLMGVPFSNEQLVDEECFAKNVLLSIGKSTP